MAQMTALERKIVSSHKAVSDIFADMMRVAEEEAKRCPFYLQKEQQCAICLTLQQRGHEARCCMFNEDYSVCSMYHVGTGQRPLNLMYEALD